MHPTDCCIRLAPPCIRRESGVRTESAECGVVRSESAEYEARVRNAECGVRKKVCMRSKADIAKLTFSYGKLWKNYELVGAMS